MKSIIKMEEQHKKWMENGRRLGVHSETSKFQAQRFYNISIQGQNKRRKKSLASLLSPELRYDPCASIFYSINSGNA